MRIRGGSKSADASQKNTNEDRPAFWPRTWVGFERAASRNPAALIREIFVFRRIACQLPLTLRTAKDEGRLVELAVRETIWERVPRVELIDLVDHSNEKQFARGKFVEVVMFVIKGPYAFRSND